MQKQMLSLNLDYIMIDDVNSGESPKSPGKPKINNRIRLRALELNKTPSELAKSCGVPYGTYKNWELGKSYMPLKKALVLSNLLKCSIHYLYYEEVQANSNYEKLTAHLNSFKGKVETLSKDMFQAKMDLEQLLLMFKYH